MTTVIDLEAVSSTANQMLDRKKPSQPVTGRMGLFLKGPIPISWLVNAVAAQRRGKALHVGLVLWLQSGIERSDEVRLKPSWLRMMGVDRYAEYRAVTALESAGLIA